MGVRDFETNQSRTCCDVSNKNNSTKEQARIKALLDASAATFVVEQPARVSHRLIGVKSLSGH